MNILTGFAIGSKSKEKKGNSNKNFAQKVRYKCKQRGILKYNLLWKWGGSTDQVKVAIFVNHL